MSGNAPKKLNQASAPTQEKEHTLDSTDDLSDQEEDQAIAAPPSQQQICKPPPSNKQPHYQASLHRYTSPRGRPAYVLSLSYRTPKRTNRGKRIVPVHQSRIADRPAKVGEKDSSLKIKIELDLEVEVEIYARVKGDIMIGLM